MKSFRIISSFIIYTLIGQAASAQNTNLDTLILLRMQETNTPGVSAVILKKGIPVWEKNYGLARISNNINVKDSTIFFLSSVSQTILCAAVMKEWEDSLLSIDVDINRYLPFHVANSFHKNDPGDTITLRQLLAHVSSVRDNGSVLNSVYSLGDDTMPLGTFLQNYFVPSGQFYDSTKNFYPYVPGKTFNVSNIGTDLAAYVLESVTHVPFDTFCMQNIFVPLCMDNTSWHLAGLDSNWLAKPYSFSGSTYTAIQQYGFPDYPHGELRTTARSLARFLAMMINSGFFNNNRILKATTVTKILTPQFTSKNPGQGLIWSQDTFGIRTCWGITGNDKGASTNMFMYDPDTSGIILLANSDSFYPADVIDSMFTLAKRLEPGKNANFNCDAGPTAISPVPDYYKTIFPNPAHVFITVEQTGNNPVQEILIFSADGKVMLNEKLSQSGNRQISVAHLANGIYFMKLIFQNQVQTIPFIKN